MCGLRCCYLFFFFNDTATTEIYTLSLHDALPISVCRSSADDDLHPLEPLDVGVARGGHRLAQRTDEVHRAVGNRGRDRKSTRLNSSHANISYAVFCLKKKNNITS